MPLTQASVTPIPPLVAQQKTESCWAAVTACIFGWRTGISISDAEAAEQLGPQFKTIYDSNQVLLFAEVGHWAQAAAFQQLPPANITVAVIETVLAANKPLIVGKTNANGMGHLVVVTSISGDGTPNNTTLQYMNPENGGQMQQATFAVLAAEFEEIAPSGNIVYAQLFKPL